MDPPPGTKISHAPLYLCRAPVRMQTLAPLAECLSGREDDKQERKECAKACAARN